MGSMIVIAVIAALDLSQPLELDEDLSTLTIVPEDDADLHRLIHSIAADPDVNIVLRLSGVEAHQDPGASWEVHVAPVEKPVCDAKRRVVGHLSLFGKGPSAEFVYRLDDAIPAEICRGLKVIFEPTSGVEVNGIPQAATVRAPVRIGRITLETARVSNLERQ